MVQRASFSRDDLTGPASNHTYLHHALNSFRLADAAFGHEERRLIMHQASPVTRSLFTKAKKLFPRAFKETSMHRFRSTKDIIPIFLALFTGFHDGTAIKLGPAEYPSNTHVTFGDDMEANKQEIAKFTKGGSYDLFFVNDHSSDSISQTDSDNVAVLQTWMASMFPDPSDFETNLQL
jgi:Stealth protein CR3, conserved region 3